MRCSATFLLTSLLTLSTLLVRAEPAGNPATASTEPIKIPAYQQGMQALADHLPEQAVTRFLEAFKVPNLTDAQNREILFRLTEAQVRANQTAEALDTLNGKFLLDHPERHFWLAQALAASGRYREACQHFTQVPESSKNYPAALISLANLELALGHNESAVATLKLALTTTNPKNRSNAAAQLASLYLEQGKIKDAEKLTKSIPDNDPRGAMLRDFLMAKFALNNKNYTAATERFKALTANPDILSQRLYQLSFIGLIDTLHSAGDTENAIREIEHFIDNHPESDILIPLLERYAKWRTAPLTTDSTYYRKLESWAGKTTPPPLLPLALIASDHALNPLSSSLAQPSNISKLSPIARYFFAQAKAGIDSPGALNRAIFEHAAFRMEYPLHPLAARSIFATAEILLKLKQPVAARACLEDLRHLIDAGDLTLNPEILTHADFISGLLSADAGDYSAALQAFIKASQSPITELNHAATLNAGLAALRSSDLAAFDAHKNKITDKTLATELQLERALWLAQHHDPAAKDALSSFLNKHPRHARAVDTRIALAYICATRPPLDPIMCHALLETISPDKLVPDTYLDYMRTRYQLAELEQDWVSAIKASETLLGRTKNPELQQEFTMRLGLAFYRNGEHNKARQILGKLAADTKSPDLASYAYYYAGMAARLEGTPQSLKESVSIFEKILTSKTPLATDARIQQARILMDLDRTQQAIDSLQKVFDPKSTSNRQLEIGILLATAYHIRGNEDPASYQLAIELYDTLLHKPKLSLAWNNQLHFRKGYTLESMGKNDKALDVYYQVINRENMSPDQLPEWHWFYRAASKAIAITIKQENIRAAIAIAKKVAAYGGPESDSYTKRSRDLEMEYMIWEE